MKKTKQKIRRNVIFLTISIILMIGATVAMLKLGQYYSSDILYQLIKRETNGYYELGFEDLQINFWKKRIKISKINLRPDSTKNFDELGLPNVYQLDLNELWLDLESISSIYFDKELIISNVRIVDPQINLIKNRSTKSQNFSLQVGNIYNAISDYLKVLRIEYFHIENGEVAHSPSDFSLSGIEFFISNLLMDSTRQKNRIFYSEEIELEVTNQTFKLPDSIHTITFDKFFLSTRDSPFTLRISA